MPAHANVSLEELSGQKIRYHKTSVFSSFTKTSEKKTPDFSHTTLNRLDFKIWIRLGLRLH